MIKEITCKYAALGERHFVTGKGDLQLRVQSSYQLYLFSGCHTVIRLRGGFDHTSPGDGFNEATDKSTQCAKEITTRVRDHYSPVQLAGNHVVSQHSPILLGWKKSFEKLNTQMTCTFMVISQLLGQF